MNVFCVSISYTIPPSLLSKILIFQYLICIFQHKMVDVQLNEKGNQKDINVWMDLQQLLKCCAELLGCG